MEEESHVVADCELPQLGPVVTQRDLELVVACSCVLRQSNKMPTLFESTEERFNQMRNWEVGSGCHKRFYAIGTCFFWFIFILPFETSGTASCGTTGIDRGALTHRTFALCNREKKIKWQSSDRSAVSHALLLESRLSFEGRSSSTSRLLRRDPSCLQTKFIWKDVASERRE